jgi:hypothetical protein
MAKRRVESQTANLTSDQKKSRIDPIYLAADNVRHTVGKISTRATTLLQTTPRSEMRLQSYGVPKLQESQLARFRDSHSGVPGEKSHLDVGPVERCRVNPLQGGRQQPLQSLEKLRKYKGGEQAPRNGNLALPKDVVVKPFNLKGLLNVVLIVLIPILVRRPDGPPGGHANLNRSFPRLE